MRIGILTGGGDCPGLNAVIRAVTRRALDRECEVIGVLHGWRGLIDGAYRPLSFADISGILPRGGTILKTSRTNPFSIENGGERALAGLAEMDAPNIRRRSSACRRRSTTTFREPIRRSGSTPHCRSRPRRLTDCTQPPNRTIA
jgi:hypothetical protein